VPSKTVHESSTALAKRLSVEAVVASIATIERVTPTLLAVTLAHERATALAGFPGNDVMVRVPIRGETATRRRYSVRSVDGPSRKFTIWVSTTHDGPGATWARGLAPGDDVDLVGPRGKIPLDPAANWHLFVGDATAFAAFYRMADAALAPSHLEFRFVLTDPGEFIAYQAGRGVTASGGFVLANDGVADVAPWLHALSTWKMAAGTGHAYVFGEQAAGRAVRSALLDAGLSDHQISLKPFWRAGVINADNGEPPKSD
jgi:NADPH-dependent ferric siderophore reductase